MAKQARIKAANDFWRECIRDWYPNLHSQTYFVPPLYFNKVPYDVQLVAGQVVLVPKQPSSDPSQKRVTVPENLPCNPQEAQSPAVCGPHDLHHADRRKDSRPVRPVATTPPSREMASLACSVDSPKVVTHPPPGPLPVVYECFVRDDLAMGQVLLFIKHLADREQETMVVVSQLDFRKYLDNQVHPLSAAAIRLLPRPDSTEPKYRRGDFDVLIISRKYGLIAVEVKSVGVDPSKHPDLDQVVLKATEKAVTQLNKEKIVLGHLLADLKSDRKSDRRSGRKVDPKSGLDTTQDPVRITNTLMLPFISSEQLLKVLRTNPQLQKALCQCLGVANTDTTGAVRRCLCADDITTPESSAWWQRTVTDRGPDDNMTPEAYETLVARFCGPATTIEVPTVTTPRRAVELRTLSDAVALTGLTISMLTLYPQQVELLTRPGLPKVFLWGPPGTGKTVVLVLKGLQWGQQGKDVHLLSSHVNSRTSIVLIEQQLLHTPRSGFITAAPQPVETSATSDEEVQPLPAVEIKTPTSDPMAKTATRASAAGPAERSSTGSSSDQTTQQTGTSESSTTGAPRVFTYFYDFDNAEGDVQKAVEKLTSRARKGELFVIADEIHWSSGETNEAGDDTSGRFAKFCDELAARVPQLNFWAAAVHCDVIPSCLQVERLTTPVRCPPAVVQQVAQSRWLNDELVPRYTTNPAPSPTDGPEVRWLPHRENVQDPLPGHTGGRPEDCECCGDNIADLMDELRMGKPGESLRYKDAVIICRDPRDDLPIVKRLRARDIPVQVVTSRDDVNAIRQFTLAVKDTVTATDLDVMSGLERRVVVIPRRGVRFDRLHAMSRCTSLLAYVGDPL